MNSSSWVTIAKDIFSILKDILILSGVIAAFWNYYSQLQQREIENAFAMTERFYKSISPADLDRWVMVDRNSRESFGADIGEFVVFRDCDEQQKIPIELLFLSEGKGYVAYAAKFNPEDEVGDLDFSAIKRIAEQLEIMSYEMLKGQIEFRIIYYELGDVMDTLYRYLELMVSKTENGYLEIDERFDNFMQVYKNNQSKVAAIPKKILLSLD